MAYEWDIGIYDAMKSEVWPIDWGGVAKSRKSLGILSSWKKPEVAAISEDQGVEYGEKFPVEPEQ